MRAAIPPLPQFAFMAWRRVKQRDSFTFTAVCSVSRCNLLYLNINFCW